MSNPVYGKHAKRSRDVEKSSGFIWALLIGLIAFLAWTPFQTALFNGQMLEFEKPIFWAAAAACILLFLWIAQYYKSIRLEDQRDLLMVGVLLLPLTYAISLISAASHYLAMNMVIIQCIYAIIFVIGLYLLRDKMGNRVIQTTIMTVAYLIVGFGLLHWFGQGKTAGAIAKWFSNTVLNGIYTNAVMVDSNGLRLTSVFQYANTYAAFLMAFLFAAIFFITTSRKWYSQAFHSFMLVPIIVSLLLTLSRGGLVMLPVVFVLLLVFLKPAKQILWILYCAIAGVASLLISKPVTELGLQLNEKFSSSGALKGWGILLGVSVVVGLLGWVIQRFVAPMLDKVLDKRSAKKGSSLWIPVGSVVIGGLLIFLFIGTSVKNILPQNIAIRLDNINFNQHSVLERFTFYKDAMKVVADYPIFGAGGGAWASLYEQYQNNPYTSRQAHNFFLQYLIEVGIVGFLIFMSFILYIFYKYIRGYMKADEEGRNSHFLYVIIVLSILMHSILDFNLSYVFMGILVFLGLGGMAAVMDSKPLTKWKVKDTTARGIYSAAVGIGAIVILITSIRYIEASSSAWEARKLAQTSESFEEIKAPLDKDLSIRPSHPDSVLILSSLYHSAYKQTQDEGFYNLSVDLLNKALKDEPYNKFMINRLIQGHELKNEKDKAFDLLTANAYKFKWDIEWYERIINQALDLGYQALGTGDTAAKDKYFKSGTEAFEKVQVGIQHLTTLPEGQLQGRAFENTPEMILNSGKMYFMTNQPDKAAATLKIGLQEDLSQTANQDIAQWYLASLQKQGQSDEALMDNLMKVNPNSKQQIQQLAELQI
ncbi:Lipid A core-O-antigen ligase and related enzymes [Paenibacillus uliginis N3/975]|uniref:Lipid A core-O-antigen ligase and related enzymes n=1 Tax=Paenibacillus uliginis N3/975 TaxID=1313296 RepID=A0A1X7GDN1_9BACL|nr:O-antigen ligase family protein [Paenibacillus uliginis]SMF68205.1 Lipid A core-O-antigen ligase and related enzymes [Paenibacillus uliginis N3/975]